MPEPTAKVIHYTDVPAQVVGAEAPGATIRWLIDEPHDGAPNYALRMIEVAAGGHTPDHTHPFEHENFVVEGRGRVRIGDEWYDVGPGSVIFVPAGVRHCYANAGDAPFRFLCGIPTPRLMPQG
ncbi:MAG: cupin domain-containing protein [Anaerolineae bacterium]|nr:cupin domain-containing protein [Anaerolineae bacterium]